VTVERVDLKTAAGQARLDALLAATDVLLTSQRPAALARLALSHDALRGRAPHLRSVAIVGDTAAPDHAGHDVTYQAEAGLLDTTLPPTLTADLAGAERAVTAVLLVLRDAPGTHRVVGLRDALAPFAAVRHLGLTGPGGVLGGGLPAYGVYPARDGHVAVAALEPHFRHRLYAVLGLPVEAPLAAAFAARSVAEWQAIAAAHDLPIAAVARPGASR
jgi:alpha-methylacyl-CoA racemase